MTLSAQEEMSLHQSSMVVLAMTLSTQQQTKMTHETKLKWTQFLPETEMMSSIQRLISNLMELSIRLQRIGVPNTIKMSSGMEEKEMISYGEHGAPKMTLSTMVAMATTYSTQDGTQIDVETSLWSGKEAKTSSILILLEREKVIYELITMYGVIGPMVLRLTHTIPLNNTVTPVSRRCLLATMISFVFLKEDQVRKRQKAHIIFGLVTAMIKFTLKTAGGKEMVLEEEEMTHSIFLIFLKSSNTTEV